MQYEFNTPQIRVPICRGKRQYLLALCGWLFLFAMYFGSAYRAEAQGYGSISGTVTDSTGAAVPGAQVTATQESTNTKQTTTTNGDGTFVFPSLAPSAYDIDVKRDGFAPFSEKGLQLRADAALTSNVSLKIGTTESTVTVNANTVAVDTTSGTLSQVVGTQQVNEMPLNGRNAAALTTLVAGVVTAPNANTDQGNTKSFPVVVAVSANGTRVGQTNYLLDGGNNIDEYTNVNAPFPMPDALQEFSVQTSNYSAEYGQNAGGVVNIVTRSGTSQYHGDLFEYVRNRVFNAANYFNFVNGVKVVDPQKRNQFGGTIGGPVGIPGLSHSNKAFFFFGYQKTILHTVAANTTAATVPTAAQRAGTFVDSACVVNPLIQVANPAAPGTTMPKSYPCMQTGTAANGTPIYTTQVDPADFHTAAGTVTQNLLTHLPTGDINGNVIFRKPNIQNLSEYTGRYDHQLTSKDHLIARYFYDVFNLDGVLDTTDLLTYQDQANIQYQNALVSESHVFNDRMLNNFILSYQREISTRGPVSSSIDAADLGVNIWQPDIKQINQIQVGGTPTSTTGAFFVFGDNPQASFLRNNYTLADDFHWQVGNHNIAIGFHGELSKVDINNLYRQPGLFQFDANGTNDAMASFLLGYLGDLQQASGQFFNARGKFFGFYVQDSWKATRRLTLDYGVRYEPFIPWHEAQGRMGGFDPARYAAGEHSTLYPNAPAGLEFAGDQGFDPDGVPHLYTHFMPRVGFAWDVYGDGKTSVRGGGGMFYDSRMSSTFFNIYSNSSPFITNAEVKDVPFNNPYAGTTNPFPAAQPPLKTSPIPFQGFLTYDPFRGFQTPVTYAWNLAVEQQITSSMVGRLAYVGTHGSHQWTSVEINPANPATGLRRYQPAALGTAGCTTLNCYPNTITEANMGGNTSYHSMQVSLEQRMSHGLTILANYTWSKALDNLPVGATATAPASNTSYVYPITVQNFKALDYGPSDFDHRNVASISYVYILPKVFADTPFAVRFLTNGWQTAGLFQYHSGDPLTVLSAVSNNSGSDQLRDRAVQISNNVYGGPQCRTATSPCVPYLNPAAFASNAPGTYGNVQKGAYVGPQYADWDVSATRRFDFNERVNLQFRAEFFNVLNHTNFLDPSTTSSSTLGRITGSNDPRIGQLSLKLAF